MGTLRDEDDDDKDQTTAENVEVEEEEQEQEPETRVVEDDDQQQDTRLNADEEDDDREEDAGEQEDDTRARRRKETARERRQRAKEAKRHDKEELAILRATIAKQDQRLNQTERALIETRISDLENRAATAQAYVNQWDEVDIKATKAGNTADAVAARQYRDQAAKQAQTFADGAKQLKEQLTKGASAQQPAPPAFTGMAQNFLREIPWYNPKSGDEDSLIVQAIDTSLSKQMDPNDPRYWEELRKRVQKRLPQRFQQDDAEDEDDDMDDDSQEDTRETRQTQRQTTQRRKGPPTGGSSRTTSTGGKVTEIRLPPQMVEAMKEAGQWDDPKKRARVAKRYMDNLRNNRG